MTADMFIIPRIISELLEEDISEEERAKLEALRERYYQVLLDLSDLSLSILTGAWFDKIRGKKKEEV